MAAARAGDWRVVVMSKHLIRLALGSYAGFILLFVGGAANNLLSVPPHVVFIGILVGVPLAIACIYLLGMIAERFVLPVLERDAQ